MGWKILISGSKKLIAVFLIIMVILGLALFVSGAINPLIFWLIAVVIAFIAYKVMPKLK